MYQVSQKSTSQQSCLNVSKIWSDPYHRSIDTFLPCVLCALLIETESEELPTTEELRPNPYPSDRTLNILLALNCNWVFVGELGMDTCPLFVLSESMTKWWEGGLNGPGCIVWNLCWEIALFGDDLHQPEWRSPRVDQGPVLLNL